MMLFKKLCAMCFHTVESGDDVRVHPFVGSATGKSRHWSTKAGFLRTESVMVMVTSRLSRLRSNRDQRRVTVAKTRPVCPGLSSPCCDISVA